MALHQPTCQTDIYLSSSCKLHRATTHLSLPRPEECLGATEPTVLRTLSPGQSWANGAIQSLQLQEGRFLASFIHGCIPRATMPDAQQTLNINGMKT